MDHGGAPQFPLVVLDASVHPGGIPLTGIRPAKASLEGPAILRAHGRVTVASPEAILGQCWRITLPFPTEPQEPPLPKMSRGKRPYENGIDVQVMTGII